LGLRVTLAPSTAFVGAAVGVPPPAGFALTVMGNDRGGGGPSVTLHTFVCPE